MFFSLARVYHSAVSEATRFLAPPENDEVLTAEKGLNFYEAAPPFLSVLSLQKLPTDLSCENTLLGIAF